MKYLGFLTFLLSVPFAQSLPDGWSQSYGTFDIAPVHEPGSYSLGFAIDNFTLYGSEDSIAYDTRRFDIFVQYGALRNLTLELKFSYPTSGVLAGKICVLRNPLNAAMKFGIGYMKGTRVGYVTDYVFDLYPTLLLSKKIAENIQVFYAPKIIYSIHLRDRQEHSERAPRIIFQYGHGLGLTLGNDLQWMIEGNWLASDNEGISYMVNQFGVGVCCAIR